MREGQYLDWISGGGSRESRVVLMGQYAGVCAVARPSSPVHAQCRISLNGRDLCVYLVL